MKKPILTICCMLLFSLSACQPTPEEAVVVDKSEGIAEESIILVDNNTPKNLNVPKQWNEVIERSDGFIRIEADYEMNIPEVYNTPIYSYKVSILSEERLKELCDFFAEGNRYYQIPKMTKDELLAEKEKMENHIGWWGRYRGNYDGMVTLDKDLGRIEELIEKASKEQEAKKYIDVELTTPYQLEEEYVRHDRIFRWNWWHYDTDKEIAFAAYIDKGQEVDPIIRMTNYEVGVGSTTQFLYCQGNWLDEREFESEFYRMETYSDGEREYIERVYRAMQELKTLDFVEEDAIKIANDALSELGIEDMELLSCMEAVGITQTRSWAGVDDESAEKSFGYSLRFGPKCEALVAMSYRWNNSMPSADGLAETVYAPLINTEQIHMIVTKDGIQKFVWTDISEKTGMVVENTKLLSFDEIKNKVADHLLYEMVNKLGIEKKNEGYVERYVVKDVQLRMANVNAFNNPYTVWRVPVWYFEFYEFQSFPWGEEGERDEVSMFTQPVMINAIDGGYVSVAEE